MRALFFVSLVFLSFGTWIGSAADAAVITYDWTGTVDFVRPGVPAGVTVGEKIDITLTLDNSAPNQSTSTNTGIYGGDPRTPPILSADIGGDTGLSPFQNIVVFDDFQGVDKVLISSSEPETGLGFILTFQTDQLGTLSSTAIPLSIDPTKFETATFEVTGIPQFLPSFSGTIDAEVPTPSSVPEPSSIAILGAALLGLGLIARSRRHSYWIQCAGSKGCWTAPDAHAGTHDPRRTPRRSAARDPVLCGLRGRTRLVRLRPARRAAGGRLVLR